MAIFFLLLSLNTAQAQSATTLLWEEVANQNKLTEKQSALRSSVLEEQKSTLSTIYKVGEISGAEETLNFSLFGEQMQLSRTHLERRTATNFTWFGESEEQEVQLQFLWNGDNLTGSITAYGDRYQLIPLGNNLVFCLLEEETGHSKCGTHGTPLDNAKNLIPDTRKIPFDPFGDQEIEGHRSAPSCSLRVLIGFTDRAGNSAGNMYDFAQLMIDQHNHHLSNSNISHRVELARVVKFSNYHEQNDGHYKAARYLNHFRSQGESGHHMDGVHGDRILTDADIAVLIYNADTTGTAGQATGIGSSSSTAFAVVKRSQATSNKTFSHELGHLFSCRHDPFVDATSTPYAYGHGYVKVDQGWRTIMAYDTLCRLNGVTCTRLSNFSNPNINHSSGSPMGTPALHDNARVINTTAPTVMGFETMPYSRTLTVNRTVEDYEYLSSKAEHSLTIDGAHYVFKKEAHGEILAGAQVKLVNGARISYPAGGNGSFRFTTEEHCIGTSRQSENLADNSDTAAEDFLQKNQSTNGALQIAPNPFQQEVTITYQAKNSNLVSFAFYDLFGRLLDTQNMESATDGTILFDWQPPENFTDQMILLQITDGDSRISEKLIYSNSRS